MIRMVISMLPRGFSHVSLSCGNPPQPPQLGPAPAAFLSVPLPRLRHWYAACLYSLPLPLCCPVACEGISRTFPKSSNNPCSSQIQGKNQV